MATIWNPGSVILVDPDADEIAFTPHKYITSTNVQGAIAQLVDELESATGATRIGYLQGGAGAVLQTLQARLRNYVLAKDFGVVGDGVTDDTEALRAAHTYANSLKVPLSYAGIPVVAVQADAQIAVNTSVDFCDCRFSLLNGYVTAPSFSTFKKVYVVEDPDTPLTAAVAPLSGTAQLQKGSRFPTLGAFDGPGYALLTCSGFTVPDRAKTGTQSYVQSFKVFRGGEAQHCLSVDLSSHLATTSIQYRESPVQAIKLANATFAAEGWNNQILFAVRRNLVTLERIYVPQGKGVAPYLSIDSLIDVENCCDVYINNFEGVARNFDISSASYNLNINGGANIHVTQMQGLNGWGVTGTNNINGMYFHGCTVNRVDAHNSGHNIFVSNCDIERLGMTFGWGGGIWKISDSRVYRASAFTVRVDYGGTFFGHLVIQDIEVEHNQTQTYILVDMQNMGASTPVHAPETITISGVKRFGAPTTLGSVSAIDVLLLTSLEPATDIVYAPGEITINDISSFAPWRFGLKLDVLNMEPNPYTSNILYLNLSNIFATNIATTTSGVVEYASARTPTNQIRPFVRASQCTNLYISFTPDVNFDIIVSDSDVNGINANIANTGQPYVALNNCILRNPVSGVSPAPVGGTIAATTGHTTLHGCKIYNATFDLQYIAAAQGCLVLSGVAPTLPGGVAIADLFTGYKAAGAFA